MPTIESAAAPSTPRTSKTEASDLYEEYLTHYPRPFAALCGFDRRTADWAANECPRDELDQACLIGVWKAALNYKEEFGPFRNYAVWHIRKEVQSLGRPSVRPLARSGENLDKALRNRAGVVYPTRTYMDDPAKHAELDDDIAAVRHHLQRLDPKLRNAVSQRYGLADDSKTHRPQECNRTQVQRGLAQLRAAMGADL